VSQGTLMTSPPELALVDVASVTGAYLRQLRPQGGGALPGHARESCPHSLITLNRTIEARLAQNCLIALAFTDQRVGA